MLQHQEYLILCILIDFFVSSFLYYFPYHINHYFEYMMHNVGPESITIQYSKACCHVFTSKHPFPWWQGLPENPVDTTTSSFLSFFCDYMEIENVSLSLYLCHIGLVIFSLHSQTGRNTILYFVYGDCSLFLFLIICYFSILSTLKCFIY